MLTPEDSKRVADAMIAEIRTISEKIQTAAKYNLPDSVERGIRDAVQSSLGYNSYKHTQAFPMFLADVKAAIYDALKR